MKHGIDIVLAGTAWIIAGTLWLEKPWNTRSFIHWILFTFIVNMLFRLTSTYYRMTGFEDARRLGTAVSVIAGTSILLRLLATPLQIDLDVPQMAFASSILTGHALGAPSASAAGSGTNAHVGSEDTDATRRARSTGPW